MNELYVVIIIGAGISGMTSAIYLKRYNLKILLLEKEIPGGQITKASTIENYPGIIKISGTEFSSSLLNQLNNLGIKVNYEEVINIKDENNIKKVETKSNKYQTKKIIIATGRKPKSLNIGEEKYIGKGISYCATCDGMFYKNQNVIVIGGGNSALEESIYLSNICKHVTIINRSNKLKADEYLKQQVENIKNIEIIYNDEIELIKSQEDKITGIKTKNNKHLECSAIFIYIGLIPNIIDIKNLNQENGYIIVDKNEQTNIKGIYAVGDVIKKELYQLITAASEGAIAANHIKKELTL